MKQETTQTPKLKAFLDKVEDFHNRYKVWIFIILYLISTSISALALHSTGYYQKIPYPEEVYQQLEEQELPNLVKNEKIQPDNLSKGIYYSAVQTCSSNEDTNYTIILEKENAKITVTGNELNLKELTIKRDKDNNEDYYKKQTILNIIRTLVIGLFYSVVAFAVIFIIYLILGVIVIIQNDLLKRKQKK